MKRVIATDHAPAAIGPYSQAVEAGNILYVSGQIAIEPSTGQLSTGDINVQTEKVLQNIGAILKAAGYTYQHVVKITCLLQSMEDFHSMNQVYSGFFREDPPARAAFAVVGLPKGALIEMDCIAVK